jgi:hypothetical protein
MFLDISREPRFVGPDIRCKINVLISQYVSWFISGRIFVIDCKICILLASVGSRRWFMFR